ncbi:protein kinase [Vibrio parahaemolyticus]|nr:protein kinase [Vibrio parahaemolyticus]MDF5053657.1 protein kinase [Vibrio parahaemolyticus]MDF5114126.1 protein kinase [Vibrio parahaemolyticus]MDF5129161.1 protein kinase [Vibrio parahaemolyticus]MDF5134031.1 protein kinase [Vibrio parahaemolyticus]
MDVVCVKYITDGSYADIWLGMDELNRTVAVKVMKEAGANVSTLEQHAEVLVKASHSNVVDVYTIDKVDIPNVGEERSIIMEYIEGITLDKYLVKKNSSRNLYEVGSQILDGLIYIHSQGLVHMDLHEQNIMVTENHKAKLIDIMYTSSLSKLDKKTVDQRLAYDVSQVKSVLCQIIKASKLESDGEKEFLALVHGVDDLTKISHAYHDVFTFARSRCHISGLFLSDENLSKLRLYKFRAECLSDVLEFFERARGKIRGYRIDNDMLPDVDVEIVSSYPKQELFYHLGNAPDTHVMTETFESIHTYTGLRW